MKFNRRDTLILGASAAAAGFAGAVPALGAEGDVIDEARLLNPAGGLVDHPLGEEDAPVTFIEYASPTCPHCAAFHVQIYPQIKENYIDAGSMRFITRPFVRNVLDAAVFMLAEAAGPTNYHNVIDTYMRTQQVWATSQTPRDAIFDIATELGFTQETFDAALTNQELFAAMEAVREQALNEFGLTGTPTFYINGKTLSGGKTFEQLAAEIDPLLA